MFQQHLTLAAPWAFNPKIYLHWKFYGSMVSFAALLRSKLLNPLEQNHLATHEPSPSLALWFFSWLCCGRPFSATPTRIAAPLVTTPETKTVKAAPIDVTADATLTIDWLVKSDPKGNYAPIFGGYSKFFLTNAVRTEANKASVPIELACNNDMLDASMVHYFASHKISRQQMDQAKEADKRCVQSPNKDSPARSSVNLSSRPVDFLVSLYKLKSIKFILK